ncbi:Rid family detoxifying hydrolase [Clostridiaceae bacterium 35-E11]
MKKVINTKSAPSAIGPYSQGILVGDFVFVSGQLPVDYETSTFAADDIVGQTRCSLENVREILKKAECTMADVVKSTVYMKDLSDFAAMNDVYVEFFTEPYPARAAF